MVQPLVSFHVLEQIIYTHAHQVVMVKLSGSQTKPKRQKYQGELLGKRGHWWAWKEDKMV